MSSDDHNDEPDRGSVQRDENAAATSRGEVQTSDVELRLRKDIARFREQARSAQAERDAAITAMRSETDARLIRSELRVAAMRNGIIDVDALRLVDADGLTVGPDGTIDGAEGVIATLKTNKPYLFEDGRIASSTSYTTSQVRRAPAPAEPAMIDARTLSREQWQAERAKMLSRHRF